MGMLPLPASRETLHRKVSSAMGMGPSGEPPEGEPLAFSSLEVFAFILEEACLFKKEERVG
jgi:hypothetical protein